MKKLIAAVVAAAMMTGCAAQTESTAGTSRSEKATETSAAAETAVSKETDASTETETVEKADNSVFVDDSGLINESGIAKINEIIMAQNYDRLTGYTGLFDLDSDGIPEVYIVSHNSGQGLMPVSVFSINGEKLGEFEGYCRDGFCRLSYGDGCVYVHNSYEHSVHTSYEDVQKLTLEGGKLNTQRVFMQSGAAGSSFPLKDFTYDVNGSTVDDGEYYTKYIAYLYEGANSATREANEVSICTYDTGTGNNEDGVANGAVLIYNTYVSGNNEAKKLFGEQPYIFCYDDFDNSGSYEALVRCDGHSENWYFWDGTELSETDIKTASCGDFTRYGSLLIAQSFKDNEPCTIIGVKDGAPYEQSANGMFIRTQPSLGFGRADLENGIFVLRKPTSDKASLGDGQTFMPHYFELYGGFNELASETVTKESFEDNPAAADEFDKLEAEGGTITEAYLLGERYLVINYTDPKAEDDGTANRYRIYMVQNFSTFIGEGVGTYTAGITE